MKFIKKNNKKEKKFREKGNEDPIDVILDDFYLDVNPIHLRLPKMEVDRNKKNREILRKYVEKNIKLNK